MSEQNINEEEVVVKIKKSQLDTIMNRLESLEKEVSGVQDVKVISKNSARMRKIDDKFVVGFKGKNWVEYNEKEKKEEMFANLVLFDGKKEETKKYNYAKFLEQSEVVEVEITKMETKIKEDKFGEVSIKECVDYRMVETGDTAPLNLLTPVTTVTINLPEIGEYICDVNSLNI